MDYIKIEETHCQSLQDKIKQVEDKLVSHNETYNDSIQQWLKERDDYIANELELKIEIKQLKEIMIQQQEEISSLKANAQQVSYREIIQNGGILKAEYITQDELNKLQNEFQLVERMIDGLNQENQRLINQQKSQQALHQGQQQGTLRDNQTFRDEIQQLKKHIQQLQRELAIKPRGNEEANEEIKDLHIEIDSLNPEKLQLQQALYDHKERTRLLGLSEEQEESLTSQMDKDIEENMLKKQLKIVNKENLQLKDQIKWYLENQILIDEIDSKYKEQNQKYHRFKKI